MKAVARRDYFGDKCGLASPTVLSGNFLPGLSVFPLPRRYILFNIYR